MIAKSQTSTFRSIRISDLARELIEPLLKVSSHSRTGFQPNEVSPLPLVCKFKIANRLGLQLSAKS